MEKDAKKYKGKAYAFFNCNASREQIEAELPKIRHVTRTPSKLELTLFDKAEVFNIFKQEKGIKAIAKETQEAGRQYILQAKYPGKSNPETADQVAGILNQAYQSPLYQEGESFIRDILYKHKGQYRSLLVVAYISTSD